MFQVVLGPKCCQAGGASVVTQVLHKAQERLGGMPGVDLCGADASDRVNRVDEGLGQPRQVMAAGTHGPSRQLIFDIGCA